MDKISFSQLHQIHECTRLYTICTMKICYRIQLQFGINTSSYTVHTHVQSVSFSVGVFKSVFPYTKNLSAMYANIVESWKQNNNTKDQYLHGKEGITLLCWRSLVYEWMEFWIQNQEERREKEEHDMILWWSEQNVYEKG